MELIKEDLCSRQIGFGLIGVVFEKSFHFICSLIGVGIDLFVVCFVMVSFSILSRLLYFSCFHFSNCVVMILLELRVYEKQHHYPSQTPLMELHLVSYSC